MFLAPNTFPADELTTDRLLLRMPVEADIEPTAEMFGDELARLWLSAPQPYTIEHARAWCTQSAPALRTTGDGVNWSVVERSTGLFVGGVGVARTHWLRRSTEIGYGMCARARGHGYAAEAARAVAEWVLLKQAFHRIELFAAAGNLRSQRVAEKAGFVREGIARNSGFTHHGQVDMVQFSMIPADLGPARAPGDFRRPAAPDRSV
ncbi:MAG TPA: GNAT family N-acetyltransferase [Actinocrinis sp.]|nr:GNAT family N-acetyltransferase [Actinocrinis sp.]